MHIHTCIRRHTHAFTNVCAIFYLLSLYIYNINRHYIGVAVSLSHVLLYNTVVIEVAFTQSLFSGNETSGVIEVTIMSTGVTQNPYEVVVVPAQTTPPSAIGICS